LNENIKKFLKILKNFKDNENELAKYQLYEAKKILLKDDFSFPPTKIAGIDAAYSDDLAYTACVTVNYKDLKIIEKKVIHYELAFPYKSGFFIFREGPPILEVYSRLEIEPDVILINSHGISHPLGIGAASHIGILLNKSTIGVAQNLLCGTVRVSKNKGACSPIIYKNKIVGYAFQSQSGMKPIYISPGHLVSLETSLKVVKSTIREHKLPEPLRLAHELANLSKEKQV